MPAVVPTRMIGVAPYSLVVAPDGHVMEVGPWLSLTDDHEVMPCYRMIDGVPTPTNPNDLAALIVPSTQDAVMNLINAGFQIKSAEVIDDG